MKKKSLTTQDFDKRFEEGKDITEFMDLKTARRENHRRKKRKR